MRTTGKNLIKLAVAGIAVVVTIVGVWPLVATLAYARYEERLHGASVLEVMSRMHLAQEQFRLANRTCSNDLTALGFENGCTKNCVYLVSLDVAANTQTFVARFVPNPAGGTNGVDQTGDKGCQWFTVDALGRRAAESQNCLEGR